MASSPLTELHQPDRAGCFWWGPEAILEKSTASRRPRRNAILLPRDKNEYLSPLHQAGHVDTAGWPKGATGEISMLVKGMRGHAVALATGWRGP